MATHTVTATITVDVTNPSALQAIGGGAQDEASQVQAAVDAGLQELTSIAGRYGFAIKDATATVS
jgi:hypothetical protein